MSLTNEFTEEQLRQAKKKITIDIEIEGVVVKTETYDGTNGFLVMVRHGASLISSTWADKYDLRQFTFAMCVNLKKIDPSGFDLVITSTLEQGNANMKESMH